MRSLQKRINEERNLCREQIEIIKERQEELPQLVVEELTKRFRIDGVIPVTPEDIRKIIEEQLSLTSTNGPMKLIIEKLNVLYAMETCLLPPMDYKVPIVIIVVIWNSNNTRKRI